MDSIQNENNESYVLGQDLSSFSYQKNQLKLQGVDDESFLAKDIAKRLEKTSKEIEKKTSVNLHSNRDSDRSLAFDTTALPLQQESLQSLKNENSFYEAKILELNRALEELNGLLNERMVKEASVEELENSIKIDQKTLDVLNNGLMRLDIADFKTLRRVVFALNPVEKTSSLPFNSFVAAAFLVSLFFGMTLSFYKEMQNPSLATIKSFEELGAAVLGGVPSTKKSFFENGEMTDGLMSLSYSRMGINLENVLTLLNSKIVIFTSAENALNSAAITLNLGSYFANTGRKILIVESDLINNSLAKITGAPLNGGISELSFHEGEVSINPFEVQKGLEVLTGDPSHMPAVYRLASQNFYELLSELKQQYDYIFLHARPCLDCPDAADLSRYAGVSVLCCDAKSIKIDTIENLSQEMKLFLTKRSYFILEDAEDLYVGYQGKKVSQLKTQKKINLENEMKKAS
jgi:Mrp family chromosome partitioning ATPase